MFRVSQQLLPSTQGSKQSVFHYVTRARKSVFRSPAEAQLLAEKWQKYTFANNCALRPWNDRKNHRLFMDMLLQHIGGSMESLYDLTQRDLILCGARGLINMYSGSPSRMLMEIYSEHDWVQWKFVVTPRGWWKELASRAKSGESDALRLVRLYAKQLEEEMGIQNLSDWNKILAKNSLTGIARVRINEFGTLREFLTLAYPNHVWAPAKAHDDDDAKRMKKYQGVVASKNYWQSPLHRRKLLEYILQQHGENIDSLYTCTQRHILEAGGATLLRYVDMHSPSLLIMGEFPEYAWVPWRFAKTMRWWWIALSSLFYKRDPIAEAVVRMFISEVAAEYNVDIEDQAMKPSYVTHTRRRQLGHLGSYEQIISHLHSMNAEVVSSKQNSNLHASETTQVQQRSREYWESKENVRSYFADLIKTLGGGGLEALYNIQGSHFWITGGTHLLQKYKESAASAVMAAFPEHPWKPWKFLRSPKGYWAKLGKRLQLGEKNAIEELRQFLEDIAQQYNITRLDQWHTLTHRKLKHATVKQLAYVGGLQRALQVAYPEHKWEQVGHSGNAPRARLQLTLVQQVDGLLPPQEGKAKATASSVD